MKTMSTTPTPPEALTPERLREIRDIRLCDQIREMQATIDALEARITALQLDLKTLGERRLEGQISLTRWREAAERLGESGRMLERWIERPNGDDPELEELTLQTVSEHNQAALALLTAAREGDDPI
jgi:hypothetical protein